MRYLATENSLFEIALRAVEAEMAKHGLYIDITTGGFRISLADSEMQFFLEKENGEKSLQLPRMTDDERLVLRD